IIAAFSARDAYNSIGRAQYAKLIAQAMPRIVTTIVLSEVGDGFASRDRWDLIRDFLDDVLVDPAVEVIPVDSALLQRALALKARRQDKRWGLTDCVSFVVMEERGIAAALTADRDFAQAG